MRAAVYDPTTSPPTFDLIELPEPALARGCVKVRVRVVPVSPFWLIGPTRPFVPGAQFTGEVVEAAPGVTTFRPGDPVVGIQRGAMSEFANVPATGLFPLTSDVSLVDASMAVESLAASFMLSDLQAALSLPAADQVVAVYEAADCHGLVVGGLLRELGIRSIGVTDHPAKVAAMVAAGYSTTVVLGNEELSVALLRATAGAGVTALIDHVGTVSLDDTWRALTRGGCFVRCDPFRTPIEPGSEQAQRRLTGLGATSLEFNTMAAVTSRFQEAVPRVRAVMRSVAAGSVVVPTIAVPLDEIHRVIGLLSDPAVPGHVVVSL